MEMKPKTHLQKLYFPANSKSYPSYTKNESRVLQIPIPITKKKAEEAIDIALNHSLEKKNGGGISSNTKWARKPRTRNRARSFPNHQKH